MGLRVHLLMDLGLAQHLVAPPFRIDLASVRIAISVDLMAPSREKKKNNCRSYGLCGTRLVRGFPRIFILLHLFALHTHYLISIHIIWRWAQAIRVLRIRKFISGADASFHFGPAELKLITGVLVRLSTFKDHFERRFRIIICLIT